MSSDNCGAYFLMIVIDLKANSNSSRACSYFLVSSSILSHNSISISASICLFLPSSNVQHPLVFVGIFSEPPKL